MKNTAIKIVSGLVVVALVVVAALAIAGVFNVKTNHDVAFAEDDASVYEQHMFRNFDADTVLYVRSVDGGTPNGTADMIIHVVDNEYNKVNMTLDTVKDEEGNIGVKPVNGWKGGMFYSVSLAAGYEFVNEQFKGLDSFMCIVAARESTEADTKVKDGIIMLQEGKFTAVPYAGNDSLYTLTVEGECPAGDNLVFVYNNGLKSAAYRSALGMGKVKDNGGSYTLTVEEADEEDVYEYIYVNKSYDVQEGDILFDLAATEASLRSSDWFLAAVHYLYGEDLAETSKEEGKWITVKFDPSFSPGTPSVVKLNITITFNGLWKDSEGNRDTNGSIVIKIANTFTPVFDVHIQNNDDGKAFDVSLDLDIETTASIVASYANSWSSLSDKENKLTDIANGLAALVRKYTSDKLGNADSSAKPYAFAKWIIPIGSLPICIEDTLGFELGASFAGEIGVVASNKFHANFGIVYAGGNLQSYHNVDDTFHFDNVTMAGSASAKAGLFNEVGISAYGTISVDLGVHAGVYADLAGRLSLNGDDIIALFKNEKSFNLVPAYYFETGVYVDLDAQGKVFGFTIKKFNLLNKRFPLYTAGHKYLPMSFVEAEGDDTIYMQNSYFYIVGWDVNALDIRAITGTASPMNLAWSEFDYEVGPNLRLVGNKVLATSADEFESYIKVTSKVNKDLSKTITIIKNPEGPTTTEAEQIYDVAEAFDLYWNVMLNSSKWLGVSVDGVGVLDTNYSFAGDVLCIDQSVFAGLSYGTHSVVVDSSKGYLKLVARVINSAEVEVDDSSVIFDKAAATAATWAMNLQGNGITSIKEGEAIVSSKYYNYRATEKQFVMLASYWDNKPCGEYIETVQLSNGTEFTLSVIVKDTRKAELNTTVYEYVAGSNADLALDIEFYQNAANVVTSVSLQGTNKVTSEAKVPAELFAGKEIGTYEGTVTVGGETKDFVVNVISSTNGIVIPVKKAVFYKSSTEAVKFAAKIANPANVTLEGCDAYEASSDAITISADFLRAQRGSEWKGNVDYAGKKIVLTITLINDVLPSLSTNVKVVNQDVADVKWDLQEVALGDVVIEGLTDEQYDVSANYLTIKPQTMAYGTTVVTVYTPVNTMTLSVKREGIPSIAANCVLNKNDAGVATYVMDTAHETFDYVEVEGADIYASAFRYNDGVLTLANEFVYNLAAGTYNVKVHLSESVLTTKLTIQGDIAAVDSIGRGTYSEPYLIYTAEQLSNVAAYINQGYPTASYKLMADIDMYGYTMTPIGNESYPYSGTFFGNGYSISNVTITEPVTVGKSAYAIGLFGLISDRGCVSDLRINNAKVSFAKSGSVSAGIVAGRSEGIIESVTIADGSISAESKSWLDIKNAYFDLGAVVGYNNGGIIRNVNVEANIVGKVKGLNVLGIQIGGRKSLINVGAVVGYFTTSESNKRLVKNIQVTASITCEADNNSVNQNGWYGYSNLTEEEAAACTKRVSLFSK